MTSKRLKGVSAAAAALTAAVGMFALTGCGNEADEMAAAETTGGATVTTPAAAGESHEGHNHPPGEGHGQEGGADGAVAGGPMMGGGGAGGPMMAGPMMGGGDLKPTPVLDAKIAELEKKGDKKALAQAYADRGYEKMMDESAAPRVKYRAALADFRLALKADPSNQKAKENKQTIEDIYRSMGRPVPGEGE